MNIVISNASPLIGLSSINCLHILKELWNEIIIPEAVYNEVVVNASGKPNVDRIADADKITINLFANYLGNL